MPGCWVVSAEHSTEVGRWCHICGRWGGEAESRRLCNSILGFIDWAVHPWEVGFAQTPYLRNVDVGRLYVSRGWDFNKAHSWSLVGIRPEIGVRRKVVMDFSFIIDWVVSNKAFSLSESLGLMSFLRLTWICSLSVSKSLSREALARARTMHGCWFFDMWPWTWLRITMKWSSAFLLLPVSCRALEVVQ